MSGLSAKDDKHQVSMFVYAMGNKANDILKTLQLTDEEKEVYVTVKGKLDGYFVKRRNTIYEQARFNQRVQLKGKSADDFIASLYYLVKHCAYRTLTNEMIRDRIVVGIQNQKLAEKLQLDLELTLDKAITMVQQSEAVKEQQTVGQQELNTKKPNRRELDTSYM